MHITLRDLHVNHVHIIREVPARYHDGREWFECYACTLCHTSGEDSGATPCVQRPKGLRIIDAARALRRLLQYVPVMHTVRRNAILHLVAYRFGFGKHINVLAEAYQLLVGEEAP